jgi:hypothetical protein
MRTNITPRLLPGLALALALAACGDEATTPPVPPRDATPPVLQILAPGPDSVLVAGPMLVRGRCSEDDARGCTVKVFLRDTLVTEGPDSVNAVVSLEKHLGQTIRFVFVASNGDGGSTRAETGEFRVIEPDVPPRLEVILPTIGQNTTRTLTTRVRLQARCTAPPECVSITAFVGQTEVARGTSSVLDTVVSLAAVGRDTVRFRFEAVNRHGTRTISETPRFFLQSSPYWSVVLTVPRGLWDVNEEQVLYTMTAPSGREELRILDRRTGADSLVAEHENWWDLPSAYLFTSGHVVIGGGVLQEYGGSNVRVTGAHSPMIRGRWLAWVESGIIHRDDVLAHKLTRTPHIQRSTANIAADGSIVYTAYPEGWPQDGSVAPQLFHLRPSGAVEQVTSAPSVSPTRPRSDGTNVVYAAQTSGISNEYRLMVHTPAGEDTLATGLVERPGGFDNDYDAEAGWVVFTVDHGHQIPRQVWARSPSGEVRRITPWATSSYLVGMGPDGQVLLTHDGRWHLARTPFSPLVDIGTIASGTWHRWIDGTLHVWFGGTLYRIET